MQYINVYGRDHADAHQKLRSQYGSEAIIIAHGKQKGGFLHRIAGKESYEIKACIPEKRSNSGIKKSIETLENMLSKQARVGEKTQRLDQLLSKELTAATPAQNFSEEKQQFLSNFKPEVHALSKEKNQDDRHSHLSPKNVSPRIELLHEDIQFIKQNLSQLAMTQDERIPDEFLNLYNELRLQDFSEEFSKSFIAELKTSAPMSEWRFAKKMALRAKELLKNRIKVQSQIGKKRIVVFVGPTGVGKTTNLAKIAQKIKFVEKRDAQLVTVDNFRIAAMQQLKIYADIMMIPFDSCKSPEQFHDVIDNSAMSVILVDTSGFSHKNIDLLARQRELFKRHDFEIETVLVVSAGYKAADLKDIFEKFSIYNISKVLLTKLDESYGVGHAIELCEQYHLPFCYFSTGQNVPEDIIPASGEYLAEKVLKKYMSSLDYEI